MGRLTKWLLHLFFPPKCMFCHRLLRPEEEHICDRCTDTLLRTDVPQRTGKYFDGCTACFYFSGDVRQSLLRFKFKGLPHYAKMYGKLLAIRLIEAKRTNYDLVTWVPISRRRKRKRRYDQSELIAQAVAEELQLPLVRTLRKTVNNPPQSRMSAARRSANVRGVYTPVCAVAGKRILLIDDVITTGATLSECSCVLKAIGAKNIHCGTVAATEKNSAKQVNL